MFKKSRGFRSFLSIFLAVVLVVSLFPSVAMAVDADESARIDHDFAEASSEALGPENSELYAGFSPSDNASPISDGSLDGEDAEAAPETDPEPIFDATPADLEGDFAKDELIVVYEEDMIDQSERLDIEGADIPVTLEDLGVSAQEELVDNSATDTSGDIVLAKLDDETTVEEAVARLEQVPGVAYVQPNYEYKLAASSATENPRLDDQYYLTSSKVTDAWKYAKASQSVTVAVIDSGCNLDHPDLEDNLLIDLAWDCISDQALSSQKALIGHGGDNNGHGTMVSGVIAAKANNYEGIIGASYDAKVLPLRVMNSSGTTYTNYVIAALQKIEDYIKTGKAGDLKIVNMSLGGYSDDSSLHASIQRMRNTYGLTLVCAGGNGDRATGKPITAPCYPSDYDECIGVTSLTKAGGHSYWSDYNLMKDISAPGEGILSTNNGGGYSFEDGTSFSAPIVSGVAALLFAACPDATPADIYRALRESASGITGAARPSNGSAGAVNAIGALAYMGIDTSATYTWHPSYESTYLPVYEYSYYRNLYRDLRTAFGYDRSRYVAHFVNSGMAEGRQGSDAFDVVSYYNANPDLRRGYGTNLRALAMHYVTNGKREGRIAKGVSEPRGFTSSYAGADWSPVYDGQFYYDKYPDLRSGYLVRAGWLSLFDDYALLGHFVNYGMAEGRRGNDAFDVVSYYNANPDLRRGYGTNLRALAMHYVTNGKREGRIAKGVSEPRGFTSSYAGADWSPVYDGQFYYDKYPDLRSAYLVRVGSLRLFDDQALLGHFVSYGMSEGRQGSAAFNVQSYRARYADLQRGYGSNLKAYYVHYLNHGRFEGRNAS